MTEVLKIEHLHKTFEAGTLNENHVLKGINLNVEKMTLFLLLGKWCWKIYLFK